METKEKIKKIIIERLNLRISLENINDTTSLFDSKQNGGLGLDSIDTLEIAVGLMEEFGVEVEENDMNIFKSVESINSFILSQSAA